MRDEAVWKKTGIKRTDHSVYQHDPNDPFCIFVCADGVGADGRGKMVLADGSILCHGFCIQPVSSGTVGPVSLVVCGI